MNGVQFGSAGAANVRVEPGPGVDPGPGVEGGTAGDALAWLDGYADDRRVAGLRRTLSPRPVDDAALDLASNDYLGLARHPRVVAAAIDAVHTWGAGSTGSRLVTGTTELHECFEDRIATFLGWPAALCFSSGYLANIGAVTALAGRGTLVVSDGGSHASLVDACRLSRARVVVTPRGDVAAVAAALAERGEQRALVLTDSVYSADGRLAPVDDLYAAARAFGAVLLVDEAHGLGVRGDGGRGLVHELGLAGAPDLVVTATMSKALGSQGGVVIGSARVRAHLVDAARSFIFDTGLAPAAVGAADAALQVLAEEPALPRIVRARAGALAAGIADLSEVAAAAPESAVVSLVLGDPEVAVAAARGCAERGVRVGCFRPPSVPAGTSRLRLTARADLGADDVSRAIGVVRAAVAEARAAWA